jgi:galactose-1-phosphate uridylyltransferase
MEPGEFRFDPLTREWVNIVGHRQTRPNLPTTGCPFCVGGLEAPEPYTVRAFENRWPPLRPGPPIELPAADGEFSSAAPRGVAEVVGHRGGRVIRGGAADAQGDPGAVLVIRGDTLT